MGKSDKRRAQGKIDEQQRMSQGYLTGLQGQLAGQYGNYGNMMFGSAPSPTNNTFGWGTTTPHYSWTGQGYFPGSTTGNNTPYGQGGRTRPPGTPSTGTAVPRPGGDYAPTGGPSGGTPTGGSGQTWTREQVKSQLMPFLNSLGAATPEALKNAWPQIQQMFPGARWVDSDEFSIPGVGLIDVGKGFESGDPSRMKWVFQGGRGEGNAGGGGGWAGGVMGRTMSDYDSIMSQYQDWAKTGGLTELDKANLRGRAVSPIRSMYSNAQREVDRTRGLQGGYSPGHTAALTRLNRDFGQNASDATLNAEAAITDLTQRGKQFGMGGMSGMYGQTPGMATTFGNQTLQAMAQQLAAGGLQNQLSMGLMGAQSAPGMMQGFPWASLLSGIGNFAGGIGQLPFGRQQG